MKKINKEGFVPATFSLGILLILIIFIFPIIINYKSLIGPVILVFGFLPWIAIYIAGRKIKSVGADIIYGIIDGGILAGFIVAGVAIAGSLGAVFAGAAGNAISDGFGGLWEGTAATWLRKHRITEARTPLSASMGKFSGVALGAGIVMTITWTILLL